LTGQVDSLDKWREERVEIRDELWRRLGDLPPLFTPAVDVVRVEIFAGYQRQYFRFENGVGDRVAGYLLLPDERQSPAPAVLFHHMHGDRYDLGKNELTMQREGVPLIGETLARAGYIVLCIDAYGFGERNAMLGTSGVKLEHSLFKKFLWEGQSLWGMMLHDDLLALDYLAAHPDVDEKRIAAVGMSMGGSRSTWVSALDERIALTIPIAQMTRYQDYAEQGDYTLHGVYYYLPGMLKSGVDMEHIVSLTAPRPQHILIGMQDPLSPLKGVQTVQSFAQVVYELYDASNQFEATLYPDVGHQFTGEMFQAMLDTLNRNFQP